MAILEEHGSLLERSPRDRTDIPIDYRYMGFLLKAAKDPEVGLSTQEKMKTSETSRPLGF